MSLPTGITQTWTDPVQFMNFNENRRPINLALEKLENLADAILPALINEKYGIEFAAGLKAEGLVRARPL
jgi:hypothetical protein